MRKTFLLIFGILLFDIAVGRGVTEFKNFVWPSPKQSHSIYHHDYSPNRDVVKIWRHWHYYRVITNSLGFRDSAVREVPLQSTSKRILIIGDSFLEGLGLNYSDTVAALLEEELSDRGIGVLNAAAGSYSPIIYYRKIKYLLEKGLQFDQLIVFIDISDIHDDALVYELDPSGNVIHSDLANSLFRMTGQKLPWKQKLYDGLQRNSVFFQIARTLFQYLDDTFYTKVKSRFVLKKVGLEVGDRGEWTYEPKAFDEFGREGLKKAQHHMNLLSDMLEAYHISMTIVVYPWPTQILARDLDSVQVRVWQDWARQKGHNFLNLFPTFINEQDSWEVIEDYFFDSNVHWNAKGNKLVADEVVKRVKEIV